MIRNKDGEAKGHLTKVYHQIIKIREMLQDPEQETMVRKMQI